MPGELPVRLPQVVGPQRTDGAALVRLVARGELGVAQVHRAEGQELGASLRRYPRGERAGAPEDPAPERKPTFGDIFGNREASAFLTAFCLSSAESCILITT